jgi:hypothetical protein
MAARTTTRSASGLGADTIIGGTGTDTADYKLSSAGVTIANDGTAGVGGWAQGDVLSGIERIEGSQNYDDVLKGGTDRRDRAVGLGR